MKVGFSSEAFGLKILPGFNSNQYSSGQVYYPIWLLNKLNSQPQRLPLVLLIGFHMGKNHPWISSDRIPFAVAGCSGTLFSQCETSCTDLLSSVAHIGLKALVLSLPVSLQSFPSLPWVAELCSSLFAAILGVKN